MWILPENVNKALGMLEESGFEGYVVGGCVRDYLMGREINDYDITTSAKTDDLKYIFREYNQILSGEKHGTVAVVIDGEVLEITTFRSDGEYADNRHPVGVSFVTSLQEDLARRDFTMNAIAYSPKTGFTDCYGGLDDINNRIIRCVGDADKRFKEDALRIMRGVRFSSQFGFILEENTFNAAVNNRHLLNNISRERIFTELCKLVMGEYAGEAIIKNILILAQIMPDYEAFIGFSQDNPHHNLTLLEHTAKVVDNLPKDLITRLTGLFHDIAKPVCVSVDEKGIKHFYNHPIVGEEMVRKILNYLKAPNLLTHEVCELVKYHDFYIEDNQKSVRKMLSKIGEELFFKLMDIKIADNIAQDSKYRRTDLYERVIDIAREIIIEKQCFSMKDLAVNGHDIIALGAEQRDIGNCLKYLLGKVIDGEIENEKGVLIDEGRMYLTEKGK